MILCQVVLKVDKRSALRVVHIVKKKCFKVNGSCLQTWQSGGRQGIVPETAGDSWRRLVHFNECAHTSLQNEWG